MAFSSYVEVDTVWCRWNVASGGQFDLQSHGPSHMAYDQRQYEQVLKV